MLIARLTLRMTHRFIGDKAVDVIQIPRRLAAGVFENESHSGTPASTSLIAYSRQECKRRAGVLIRLRASVPGQVTWQRASPFDPRRPQFHQHHYPLLVSQPPCPRW